MIYIILPRELYFSILKSDLSSPLFPARGKKYDKRERTGDERSQLESPGGQIKNVNIQHFWAELKKSY